MTATASPIDESSGFEISDQSRSLISSLTFRDMKLRCFLRLGGYRHGRTKSRSASIRTSHMDLPTVPTATVTGVPIRSDPCWGFARGIGYDLLGPALHTGYVR